MTLKDDEAIAIKRANFFQIINTFILTVIGIFTILVFITVGNIKDKQSANAVELARMKAIQDENVLKITKLESQQNALMYEYKYNIQVWVDANFKRK
jgi:hypothetical protein